MNLPKPSAAVLCLIVCARPLLAADSSGPPDMVLFNGKVFTADASHPHVQGLAIRGDRIMETGESVAIRALSGPHTRLIDLGGHTVLLEGDKGSLAKGKLADLAVLSQDIFTVPVEQLPSTVSILTMIGGAIVYEAHAGTAP
jgi:predicted amidohydrolase YtcJ